MSDSIGQIALLDKFSIPIRNYPDERRQAMKWMDYRRPKDTAEVLTLSEQAEGRGRIIADFTNLILQLRKGQCEADLLVDITDSSQF